MNSLIEYFRDPRFVSLWEYDFYTNSRNSNIPAQRHRIVLKDGVSMSVQASETHYCSPRYSIPIDSSDSYYEYEIGFPSEEIRELMPYAENIDRPTDTVYPYVPFAVIQDVICAHGGIDVQATLALIEEKKRKENNK